MQPTSNSANDTTSNTLPFDPELASAVLPDLQIEAVSGARSQTAGGGNTSIWGKIKSVWFGVDASFYA